MSKTKKHKDETKNPDFVFEEFSQETPPPAKKGVFYANKAGLCSFIDPTTGDEVSSSLSFLKIKIEKEDPLTIVGEKSNPDGVIATNPAPGKDTGDFSNQKPFKVIEGKVIFLTKKEEE